MAGTLDNLKRGFASLNGKQKTQLVLAVVAIVGLVWGVSVYATRVRYGTLFSNIRQADAGPVLAELKTRQVPYRVTAGGSVIEVPVERIDELRLELAGEGLLPGGGVGFEVFDKPSFGMSDFVQNVNYRRALERELARTIQSLDSVEAARVHLALPPASVFADERNEPTASVVVRLRSGGTLSAGRVRAVTHMVASGVEGLSPERVSVVDGEGRMLSDDGGDDPAMSASQAERKRAVEASLESTLVSILEPVVGKGRVRARATVELNMTRISRVQETYDPDGAVLRSEQKMKSEQRAGTTGGVPGTASNLPGGTGAAAAGSSPLSKQQSATNNFEINKTVSTIHEPVGSLARQSVAVVVDHAAPPPGEGEEGSTADRPRTDEEMRQITGIVQAAIGFDDVRGDTLIVENVPFDDTVRPDEELQGGIDIWRLVTVVLSYASLPLAILLIALLVIRPGFAVLRALKESAGGASGGELGGPVTVAELQAQLASGSTPALGGGGSAMRRKLIEAANEDPKAAALLLREWMGKR